MKVLSKVLAALFCLCWSLTARANDSSLTWELQLPGISHHFGTPSQANKSYRHFHDGLGIQRTDDRGEHVVRYSAGFMRDSFGHQGLYIGGSVGYRFNPSDTWRTDVSAAPMLLYRTTRFDDQVHGNAPYRWIPIVLPVVAVQHKPSGIGANIIATPGGNFGKNLKFPGLIYAQFTYRLR